jgi:hypothetical protein
VETARELGIDWWENDPWLTSNHTELEEENRRLRDRVAELEDGSAGRREIRARPAERRDERSERGRGSARRNRSD